MAVLTVRRPSPNHRELLFQGQRLAVGTDLDTRDFPRVEKDKWAQLIRLGILLDEHLSDPDIARALKAQRVEFGESYAPEHRPEPGVPVPLDEEDIARLDKPMSLQCGECGKQMTSEHGLKVHVGRQHGRKSKE